METTIEWCSACEEEVGVLFVALVASTIYICIKYQPEQYKDENNVQTIFCICMANDSLCSNSDSSGMLFMYCFKASCYYSGKC